MSTPAGPTSNGQEPSAVHSADAAFERLLSEVEGAAPVRPGFPQTSQRLAEALSDLTRTGGGEPLRAAVARSLDLFSDLVVGVTELVGEVVDTTLRSTDGGRDTGPDQPVALVGPPGGHARATVWVHSTAGATPPVALLRLTDLTAHDGTVLPGSSATFAAGTVPAPSPARASARLEVALPAGLAPGVYHGHVLATGVPDAAVPVRLQVEP